MPRDISRCYTCGCVIFVTSCTGKDTTKGSRGMMTTLKLPKTRLQPQQITPAEPFSKQAGVQLAAALTQPDGLQTQHATRLTQPASQ